MQSVTPGLEVFVSNPPPWTRTARVGLLTHPAAVDRSYRSSAEVLARLLGERLSVLFSPQHGFFGEKQANMVESSDSHHPTLGLRIASLYGKKRRPDPADLAGLDVMLVDLQDIGCRVYTYIQTLSLVMEACAEHHVKVVVLDRPNPLGRTVEGNLLDDDCRSFVGRFRLPMRHGLTIGEAAGLLAGRGLDIDLEVTALTGYDPSGYFETTGLPWVMPSPNMPSVETAVVYPGQVLFEGTNLSEGRGTTRPFELWGAPFIDPYRLEVHLRDYRLPGLVLRPVHFEPAFDKFAGRLCGGFFLHVTDRRTFRPYRTSLALLQAALELWPEEVAFSPPPYEYEFVRRPIDLILGRRGLADQIASGGDLGRLEKEWATELDQFINETQRYYLY